MSVRLGLLTLLARSPMHGYQLRQEFESETGSTWPLNIGQVYTTLGRLVRDQLIQGTDDGEDSQRVFEITDGGRAAVREWFSTPVTQSTSPPRNELAIKLALAVTAPGVDVAEVIQTQRNATIRSLQEYTRARENAGDDLSWLLVADSLIFAAEAEIHWLDHSETRILRFPSAPTLTPPSATSGATAGGTAQTTATTAAERATGRAPSRSLRAAAGQLLSDRDRP